jgi:hypothetical protein
MSNHREAASALLRVTPSGSDPRARGEFTISRGDYNIKATSALHGLVRVRGRLKFVFDIVAHRIEISRITISKSLDPHSREIIRLAVNSTF